ncbi:MAG: hypothetical protein JJU02_08395 [Cryomorphaceae bacterium]|nr:hypothetical protein [Cryomorphaceae bacterium]
MEINIIPYDTIKNQNFGTAVIKITQKIFDGVSYLDNRTNLNFDNCKFQKLIISNESKIDFERISLNFSFCHIQDIQIESIETEQISLHFHGCIVSGNINQDKFTSVSINNCVTPSLFLQYQARIDISYTEENIFIRKWKTLLKNSDVKSANELISLKQSLYINHSKNINIRFNHNEKTGDGVYRTQHEQIEDYRIRYHLTKEDKKKLNINLNFDFSRENDEQLKIQNCILNSLSMQGSANGKITIENTKINNLYIREFSSESEMLLYNISPYLNDSKLEVHKSNMDNCWFDNIDFNGYELLSLFRSRFANSTFTSCNFPKDSLSFEKFKTLENIHYSDKKPQNYYKDQYETFLQLRKSLEGTGNYYEAQKLSAISKDSLRKVSTLSKSDKFILCLNSLSNNHGLSIKRPFIGLFVFSILFYILYLNSIDRIFKPTDFDWTLVGQYFSFLDLTHRNDFLIPKAEFTFWTLFLDFGNKIIVGFFIFQFISAFRKYVKK